MADSGKPKAVRLSPPQIELLTDIATCPVMYIRQWSRWDKTAQVLVREKLAKSSSEGPGHYAIRITEAGKAEAVRRGLGVTDRRHAGLGLPCDQCGGPCQIDGGGA